MAAIGSGINPALGRVDYSPFLQGAQMAAQGRIQGSNALAEGVSQGFQDYLKKREQNAILEGKNNALLRDIAQDPQLSANPEIQKYTAKMAKGGPLTLNDQIKLNAELTTTVEAAKMRREEQRQQEYLALQQESARLNAIRAAREQAEYARKNEVNTAFMRGMASGKAKTPEEIAALANASGMNLDEFRQATGFATDLAAYQRASEQHKLNMDAAKLEYDAKVAAYKRGKDKPEFETVTTDKGATYAVFRDSLTGAIIKTDQIEKEKPEVGQQLRSQAYKYYAALAAGDLPAAAEAIANGRKLTAGQKYENYDDNEFGEKVFGPFRGDLSAAVAGKDQPLVVAGAPKPVSATPAPTAEDARITQGKSFYQMGTPVQETRQVKGKTYTSTGKTYSDAEVAEQQRQIDAAMGVVSPQAPAPSAAPAQPAPAAAPAPAPAQPQARPIPFSPDFGGGFGDAPAQPPVQPTPAPDLGRFFQEPAPEIILDEALLPKPRSLGRMFAPKEEDKNQPPVITETMLRMADRNRPIEPGQKNITASQLNRLREEEAAQAPSKLRQSALNLLEPKKGDSADTLAIKQIIPYLPNRVLADKLLKQLSEKKEPKISSFDKDPFVRSMLAAAKEGRLSQLNMAAGRGF